MARVDAPAFPTQVLLVARVRSKLFRNSLRTWRGSMEAVSLVILGLVMSSFALASGLGLGIFSFFCVKADKAVWLSLPLWFVFVFWQLLPIFVVASAPQLDFLSLLRFPLRFSSFFLLSLVYGLFDPFALAACFWLACIGFGICLGNPGLLLWTPAVLLVFGSVNLLLGRVIYAWLHRWLALRRTREVLALILLLGFVTLQLISPAVNHFFKHSAGAAPAHQPLAMKLAPLAQSLPPGLAAEALTMAGREDGTRAAVLFVLLSGYGLVFASLLSLRLRAQYRGEDLNGAPTPRRISVKGRLQTAWKLPGVSAPLAALFEKELRYLARNRPMLFALLAPLVLFVFFQSSASLPLRELGLPPGLSRMTFPLAAIFVLLGFMNLAFNSFAYESRGLQLLLAAPIRFRDVFLAKNLMQLLVAILETVVVWVATVLISGSPETTVCLATLCALLFALPVNLAVGNLVSVYFPLRREFGVYRRKANSGIGALTSFGVEFFLVGASTMVVLWTGIHEGLVLAIPAFLVLACVAAWGYVRVLDFCERAAASHREALMEQLCR